MLVHFDTPSTRFCSYSAAISPTLPPVNVYSEPEPNKRNTLVRDTVVINIRHHTWFSRLCHAVCVIPVVHIAPWRHLIDLPGLEHSCSSEDGLHSNSKSKAISLIPPRSRRSCLKRLSSWDHEDMLVCPRLYELKHVAPILLFRQRPENRAILWRSWS